jgi:hypothetical protein
MIIALCGCKGSGKDTMGNILINKYGFKKLAFASVLKDIISIIFCWNRELLEGNTRESRIWREQIDEWWSKRLNIPNLTPRYVLEFFGTELFRNHFHDEIWLAIVEKQLEQNQNIVITDCRFPNEKAMLEKYNTKFIKIIRDTLPNSFLQYQNYKIESINNTHPSDYLWLRFNFDYEFNNNSDIKTIETFIDSILI